MKNTQLLIIIAVVLILLFILRKPINKSLGMTRGYKNNNFGNIRLTFDKNGKKTFWEGEIEGTDKSFKTFKSPAYGYRAMFLNLRSYFTKGIDTIEEIINRYAPSSENNTEAYIQSVVKFTGYSRSEPIDTKEEQGNLVAALSYHENGIKPNLNDIKEGFKIL